MPLVCIPDSRHPAASEHVHPIERRQEPPPRRLPIDEQRPATLALEEPRRSNSALVAVRADLVISTYARSLARQREEGLVCQSADSCALIRPSRCGTRTHGRIRNLVWYATYPRWRMRCAGVQPRNVSRGASSLAVEATH
jgi:hypothetical protein